MEPSVHSCHVDPWHTLSLARTIGMSKTNRKVSRGEADGWWRFRNKLPRRNDNRAFSDSLVGTVSTVHGEKQLACQRTYPNRMPPSVYRLYEAKDDIPRGNTNNPNNEL